MATKPSTSTEWATTDVANGLNNTDNKQAPTPAQLLTGFTFPDAPARNTLNWWMNAVYQWNGYFEEATDDLETTLSDLSTQITDAVSSASENVDAVGTLKAFTRNTTADTDGYLPATGGEADRTGEAALFNAVGTLYGTGDGSSTFGLPDLDPIVEFNHGFESSATNSGYSPSFSAPTVSALDSVNNILWVYDDTEDLIKSLDLDNGTEASYGWGSTGWGGDDINNISVDTTNELVYVSRFHTNNDSGSILSLDYGNNATNFVFHFNLNITTNKTVTEIFATTVDEATGHVYALAEVDGVEELWWGENVDQGSGSWAYVGDYSIVNTNGSLIDLEVSSQFDKVVVSTPQYGRFYSSTLSSTNISLVASPDSDYSPSHMSYDTVTNNLVVLMYGENSSAAEGIAKVSVWDGYSFSDVISFTTGLTGSSVSRPSLTTNKQTGQIVVTVPTTTSSLGSSNYSTIEQSGIYSPGVYWFIKS